MSIADDRLEILIGKLLDGEISPAEQRLLDGELEQNSQARELLEQLRTLHECGREAIAGEVLSRGANPETVFHRAWQRAVVSYESGVMSWKTQNSKWREARFAIGLAAGLILGLGLHFVLVWGAKPSAGTTVQPMASNQGVEANDRERIRPAAGVRAAGGSSRSVDWYGFTDPDGNRWLVQGLREGTVKPVAFRGDF